MFSVQKRHMHKFKTVGPDRPLPCYACPMPLQAPARDQQLIQIVNSALSDAFQKSSKWLACRPGCSQCCVGVFAINQLDAIRLRKGLAELEQRDSQRAARRAASP